MKLVVLLVELDVMWVDEMVEKLVDAMVVM
jgi:hypothetical protein